MFVVKEADDGSFVVVEASEPKTAVASYTRPERAYAEAAARNDGAYEPGGVTQVVAALRPAGTD